MPLPKPRSLSAHSRVTQQLITSTQTEPCGGTGAEERESYTEKEPNEGREKRVIQGNGL